MTRHVITAQKQKRKKSSVYWFSHTHTHKNDLHKGFPAVFLRHPLPLNALRNGKSTGGTCQIRAPTI